jgi:hypothetical protein
MSGLERTMSGPGHIIGSEHRDAGTFCRDCDDANSLVRDRSRAENEPAADRKRTIRVLGCFICQYQALPRSRRAGWEKARLDSTAKGHGVKARTAVRLQRETTVMYGRMAERLQMGSRSHVSNLVYAKQKCKK